MNDDPATGGPVEPALDAVHEALSLLAAHDSSAGRDSDAADRHLPALPLPSLLARCEALLSADTGPEDTRLLMAHGFALPSPDALGGFLSLLPNVVAVGPLLPPLPGAHPAAAATDPALMAQLADVARAGALTRLHDELTRQGLRPFLLSNGDAGPGATAHPEALEILALVHPLLAYLALRDRAGEAAVPTLEDFAGRMTRFLDDHAGLPVLACDRIAADPAAALTLVAEAWHLSVSPEGLARAKGMAPASLAPADAALLARITYPDGSAVIEQPLDSPAYAALCHRLGYDPRQLAGITAASAQGDHTASDAAYAQPAPEGGAPALLADFAASLRRSARQDAREQPEIDLAALSARIDQCLAAGDGFLEALDQQIELSSPQTGALLKFAAAAHFLADGQKNHGLGFIAEGGEMLPGFARRAALAGGELYLRAGSIELGLRLLLRDALDPARGLGAAAREALEAALQKLGGNRGGEHGQVLLMDRLQAFPPTRSSRQRVMIEVGTTRESVPGQGSTEKLARLCAEHGITFITVDMDPRNSANARKMFRRLGLPFHAVTAKGEDFLADYDGLIDYVFLDAYDFDHGMHSELRQSRYEAFLGSRIEEAQCHQMHLDCAFALREKLSEDGLICFDDTWRDAQGNWTAKGATAMPYLLQSGFALIEARNRAALLRRI